MLPGRAFQPPGREQEQEQSGPSLPPRNPWQLQQQNYESISGHGPATAEQRPPVGLPGVDVGGRQDQPPPTPSAVPSRPTISTPGLSLSSSYSFQGQQAQHGQSQQQSEDRQPPSVLRYAVNAPHFVPKASTESPALGANASPSLPAQASFGNLRSTAMSFEPSAASNRLDMGAVPFVPGGGGGGIGRSRSSAGDLEILRVSSSASVDGLNTQAMPFEPGGSRGGGGATAGLPYGGEAEEDDLGDSLVNPLHHYGDEIFDWSFGGSSLPAPPRMTLQRMGVPEQLRQFFLLKDLDKGRSLPPDDPRYKEIPPGFHHAYPLDDAQKARGTAGAFGYPSVTYKVLSHEDGRVYALRRFDSVRSTPKIVAGALETWRRIQHPNIIQLSKVFIQHGNALFFLHEYHPGAQSVTQRYVDSSRGHSGARPSRLPEKLLWSFVTQLVSAIRAVHAAQAACRMLHPNHVLVTTGARLRLGCAGVVDVLESETRKTLAELQTEDLAMLGRLILTLATRTLPTPQSLGAALAQVRQQYSPELHALSLQLCSKPGLLSVFELVPLLSRYALDELDRQYAAADDLEGHLSHEYESGRLFRLSLKLAQVTGRAEAMEGQDPAWNETGTRYILKLFKVRGGGEGQILWDAWGTHVDPVFTSVFLPPLFPPS
ncbi:pab-dependent poly -specific ribonuclease subunit 3, partial [Nannochloropsis gaditana]